MIVLLAVPRRVVIAMIVMTGNDRHDRDDKPVIGFADHVPAFLLTPVPGL